MLVAANVHAAADSSRLTLRQTTILPNLPGLPPLVCLIFAPQVELRVDNDEENITGGLFGLGLDINKRTMFPEHDIELCFDTEIDLIDIRDVSLLTIKDQVFSHLCNCMLAIKPPNWVLVHLNPTLRC